MNLSLANFELNLNLTHQDVRLTNAPVIRKNLIIKSANIERGTGVGSNSIRNQIFLITFNLAYDLGGID